MASAMATTASHRRQLLLIFVLTFYFLSSELRVVHGQPDTLGFISIDCGTAEGTSYPDESTNGLRYVSDAGFVDAGAGANAGISPPYSDRGLAPRYLNVRYFFAPSGGSGGGNNRRSCYTLRGLTQGAKYLVRCSFYYGNYDQLSRLPAFDLYLGVHRWAAVNVTAADDTYILEAVTVSPAEFLTVFDFQVCLVDIGLGTPFISGLDLRPLRAAMYPEATVNQSLLLLNFRRPTARYPFDSHDRLWQSYGDVTAWTNITTATTVDIKNSSSFDEPSVVLQSAATPVNGTQLDFSWSPDPSLNNDNNSTAYLLLLYFAELQRLPSGALRRFDVLVDGASWDGSRSYSPKYLSAEVVERVVVQGSGQHTVSLVATPDATLPPILNAFEIYSVRQTAELGTNNGDGTQHLSFFIWQLRP